MNIRVRAKGKGVGASTMVFAAMFSTLLSLVAGSYLTVISSSSVGSARISEQQRAYYAAEAGIYRLLYELNTSGSSRVSGALSQRLYRGTYSASFDNVDTITSVGTVGTMRQTVTTKVDYLPPGVRAAVTVQGNVRTDGRSTLDGRTYNPDGRVISQKGVYGVSTTGTLRQHGHSLIGGNGQTPAHRAHPNAIEQRARPLPSTEPWDLLGVSRAWFTLNVPLRVGLPPAGFNGIWYTATPLHRSANLDDVKGILIVHNARDNATLRNVHGTFKGLIIADRIKRFSGNAKIYGAVIATHQNGKTISTSRALIAYSPKVLASLAPLVGGNTSLWRKTLQAGSWQESSGRNVGSGTTQDYTTMRGRIR